MNSFPSSISTRLRKRSVGFPAAAASRPAFGEEMAKRNDREMKKPKQTKDKTGGITSVAELAARGGKLTSGKR